MKVKSWNVTNLRNIQEKKWSCFLLELLTAGAGGKHVVCMCEALGLLPLTEG